MMKYLNLLLLLVTFAAAADDIKLVPVASGLDDVTSIANAGDERLFLVEQTGLIRVFDGERLLDEPLLDMRPWISCCGERGLLSIAFHPNFKENGFFFISYTDVIGRLTVERYRISDEDRNRADETSGVPLLQIIHINATHNSGELAFGPDGFLYVGVGDGGSKNDSDHNAQDLGRYLGKILRIDVDHGDFYSIPDSNPFAGRGDALGEIWAYGLRNPWRFSFDRQTGDFWIADVGETAIEEIDFQPAGSAGGQNYGWNLMEGTECFTPGQCNRADLTPPLLEYHHDSGCAVIGGYRYRGAANPVLQGLYFYADYCNGTIWAASESDDGWDSNVIGHAHDRVRTFGEDADGELYIATESGTLWQITSSVPRLRSVRH